MPNQYKYSSSLDHLNEVIDTVNANHEAYISTLRKDANALMTQSIFSHQCKVNLDASSLKPWIAILNDCEDTFTQQSIIKALNHFAKTPQYRAVMHETRVIESLIPFLSSSNKYIVQWTISAIEKLVIDHEETARYLHSSGGLNLILSMKPSPDETIQHSAAGVINNHSAEDQNTSSMLDNCIISLLNTLKKLTIKSTTEKPDVKPASPGRTTPHTVMFAHNNPMMNAVAAKEHAQPVPLTNFQRNVS